MTMLSQNMVKMQNFVISIYRAQINCLCKNRWYLQRHYKNVETRFDTSDFEIEGALPKE